MAGKLISIPSSTSLIRWRESHSSSATWAHKAFANMTTFIDEPRRSGRATKGQHTKAFEIPDGPPSKRKGKAQSKPKQSSTEPTPPAAEEEYIRCICGHYEEEEEIER